MQRTLILFLLLSFSLTQEPVKPTPANKAIQAHQKDQKIQQVSQNGTIITLTNGKKYRVHPEYRNISGGWLLPSKVTIRKAQEPNTFILKNLSTKATVKVSPLLEN